MLTIWREGKLPDSTNLFFHSIAWWQPDMVPSVALMLPVTKRIHLLELLYHAVFCTRDASMSYNIQVEENHLKKKKKNREEEINYFFPAPIWYRLTHCRPLPALLALLSTPVIRKLLIHLFQPLPTNSNPKYLLSNFDSSFLTWLPILSDSFSSSPVFFFSPPVQLDYTVFFTSTINYTTQVTESS